MKKILVVDNHPLILQFMTNLLVKEGHQVLTAQDGLSALDILKTETPDIMFVDLIMPNISGEKLCQVIRRIPRLKDLYIIILSAVAAEHEVNLAEMGANACIAKGPFNKMARHVHAVLDQLDPGTSCDFKEEIVGLEDITARHVAKELLSIRRHFEVTLASMSEGILEITPEARIVYANPSAISLIGTSEENLLGSNFIELFGEMDRQRIQYLLGAAIRSTPEKTADDASVTLNGKDVLLNISPVADEAHASMIIILNDVTQRKRLEAQFQQASKMETIGTLAGGIAHDFNNLLMGIQGNVSLMLMNMDATHSYYERLRSIEKQVQSGAKLTSHLLGYARKGRYEVKPIDLNQLVEEASDTFGRAKKEITIHRELAEDLLTIEADHGQIEQVLLNLFVNAADAMPGGGDLILKTKNTTHEDMRGKLYDPKPGNYVVLTVTDTGMGMDQQTRMRIFDPFFTTKEMGRGTGLGLASAYGIIKGHGGYIDVDSKKGHGTTFSIYLPASGKKAQKAAVQTPDHIIRGTETVLLVDDEEPVRQVGRELLEAMGYRVLIARDGKEAIEIYKQNQDEIDIILLDMVMPKMGGGEVYDRIKEINPDIKVLLLSGYSIEGEADEILDRGCNGFIQKPFDIKELSYKLRDLLNRDRGRPHDLRPPTPPCIRVRTRRFI
ncbi:MAG: response regulator [Deltaproteobacteria bacterium]|nr:response regulator [Deltaproteobacteria bacterium]